MSDQKPIKKIRLSIPVSKAILDSFDAARALQERWQAMTPAEQEAETQARKAARDREQAAVIGLHREACAGLDGKLLEVALLHGAEDTLYPLCRGCDVDGYEGEQPDWPCRTYTLVTGVDWARVQEVREAAREA